MDIQPADIPQVGKKLTPAQKKQQDLFKDMAEQLSQDFDKKLDDRLARFENMLAAIANTGSHTDDQPPAKRKATNPADTDSHTIVTRADIHVQPPQVKEPAILKNNSVNTNTLPVQPSNNPVAGQTPEVTSAMMPPFVNNNIATNTWLLDQARQQYPNKIVQPLPTAACDLTGDPEVDEQVQQILASATHQLAHGAGKPGIFPHKYIYKGPERRRVGLNTLSVQEHVTGIFLIIDDEKVPNDIKPHLLKHIQEVLDDACHYDWPNAVRRWSEDVFSAIAENLCLVHMQLVCQQRTLPKKILSDPELIRTSNHKRLSKVGLHALISTEHRDALCLQGIMSTAKK